MRVFAALLCAASVGAIHVEQKSPLTSAEKAAVGKALGDAISALKGNRSASKMESCLKLFPDRKQGTESEALWLSCKDELVSAGLMQKTSTIQKKQDPVAGKAPESVDAEAYEKDWQNEFKTGAYPEGTHKLQHHPDYRHDSGGWRGWWWGIGIVVFVLIVVAAALWWKRAQ